MKPDIEFKSGFRKFRYKDYIESVSETCESAIQAEAGIPWMVSHMRDDSIFNAHDNCEMDDDNMHGRVIA